MALPFMFLLSDLISRKHEDFFVPNGVVRGGCDFCRTPQCHSGECGGMNQFGGTRTTLKHLSALRVAGSGSLLPCRRRIRELVVNLGGDSAMDRIARCDVGVAATDPKHLLRRRLSICSTNSYYLITALAVLRWATSGSQP